MVSAVTWGLALGEEGVGGADLLDDLVGVFADDGLPALADDEGVDAVGGPNPPGQVGLECGGGEGFEGELLADVLEVVGGADFVGAVGHGVEVADVEAYDFPGAQAFEEDSAVTRERILIPHSCRARISARCP
jgi:hypothetical protein